MFYLEKVLKALFSVNMMIAVWSRKRTHVCVRPAACWTAGRGGQTKPVLEHVLWVAPVRVRKPREDRNPARTELKGNVPTSSTYTNCEESASLAMAVQKYSSDHRGSCITCWRDGHIPAGGTAPVLRRSLERRV